MRDRTISVRSPATGDAAIIAGGDRWSDRFICDIGEAEPSHDEGRMTDREALSDRDAIEHLK